MPGLIPKSMKPDRLLKDSGLPPGFLEQVPGTYLYRRKHYRRRPLVSLGVALGMFVAGLTVTLNPGGAFSWHTVCVNQDRLGNVTAWSPREIVDGPYLGDVSFTYTVWQNFSWGWIRATFGSTDGHDNVSALNLGNMNFSIVQVADESVAGPGESSHCPASMLAEPSVPTQGGGYFWDPLAGPAVSDTGIPYGVNASGLCATFNLSSSCAVSPIFDANFTPPAVGSVDTCGQTRPTVLGVQTGPISLRVPFRWQGRSYDVLVDYEANALGRSSGFESWENYTFPANAGLWAYSFVPGAPTASGYQPPAGLAFSYEPCP